ncbi:host specificity protein J, partial [Pseudomonas savastanoi pv. glycinea]
IPYRSEVQLSDRIKTLEACVVQLNSELGRLVVAVSSLVSGNTKQ